MKTYLSVPFSEKDSAKARGARWDAAARKWYCPDGIDLREFERWLPGEIKDVATELWREVDSPPAKQWRKKVEPYREIVGPTITGPDYFHDPRCRNCVPPWEVSPHGCPNAIDESPLSPAEQAHMTEIIR